MARSAGFSIAARGGLAARSRRQFRLGALSGRLTANGQGPTLRRALMRVLLSTIGSRGDVQPLVALALELRALGQEVRLCVPPDFRDWIDGLGMPVVPIGPSVRSTGRATAPASMPTPDQLRQAVEGTVATQFDTIAVAAQDCDVI